MTSRDLTKELQYFTYTDMERGNDTENIHYPALILILQDLVERVEQLEKVNKENLSLLNLVEKMSNDG
jgi:hypothetical protein